MESYRIETHRSAEREIRRIRPDRLPDIVAAVRKLATEPRPPGVTKLEGDTNAWRIRVGDYRVVYEIDDTSRVVIVRHVRHRREAYRRSGW